MDDLISRQAVIEINRSYHGQMPNEVNHRIWKEINELPSAQPEKRTEERTETHACDCISRKDAIDAIEKNAYRHTYLNQIIDIIKALPSAQPERAGRCVWCDGIEGRRLRIEFYWIDDDGNTASFSEPHIVATGIAKYCPECGRKLKMEVEHDCNLHAE